MSIHRWILALALGLFGLVLSAKPAQAQGLFIQVHSAHFAGNQIEMVISTNVTHSCFRLRTTSGIVRSVFGICVTGNEQTFVAPVTDFPDLRIDETLVLETGIAPIVASAPFQFSGNLVLHSVRIVGGTEVEFNYTKSFATCVDFVNAQDQVITRATGAAFCEVGEAINVVVDREFFFTNIQPGMAVRLRGQLRRDIVTNSVVVGSTPSPLPCVLSKSTLTVHDRGTIVANKVYAEGFIDLRSDSVVTGQVLGRDDARLLDRATINGNVSLIGRVTQNNGTINGSLFENVPVASQTFSFNLVADDNQHLTVPWDQTVAIPPGRYGNVVVHDRGKLRLNGAGSYSFTSLTFGSDTQLQMNTNQGEYNVEVAGNVSLGHRFATTTFSGTSSVDGSKVFMYAGGSNPVTIPFDGVVRAQLRVPGAPVVFQDRGRVHGCVRASGITLGNDARILAN